MAKGSHLRAVTVGAVLTQQRKAPQDALVAIADFPADGLQQSSQLSPQMVSVEMV